MSGPEPVFLSDPGSTVSGMKRCDWSDLLIENCGHCKGTPDLDVPADVDQLPEQVEGTWTVAIYDSECGCGCNRRIGQGDEIVLAKVGDIEDWVLEGHSRKPWVAP